MFYENGLITCKYKNYLDELQDYNDTIIFDFVGEQIEIQVVNGIATVDFEIIDSGEYIVKTANANIDNGEVIINA